MYDEVHCINPLSIAHLQWGPQGYDIAWENLKHYRKTNLYTYSKNPIIIIKDSICRPINMINEDNVIKQHI